MSSRKLQADQRSKRIAEAASPESAQLEVDLSLLSAQRAKDQERLRQLTQDRDRLRFQLSERNANEAQLLISSSDRVEEGGAETKHVNDWLLKATIVRAAIREEHLTRSLLGRVLAAMALPFARRAAKRCDYASAEVLYQFILLLAPRPFIWRQTGNMLAGQGLYAAAIDCFDNAIEGNQTDAEAWHARGVALRQIGNRDKGTKSIKHAINLDPSLASRSRGQY